MKQILFAGLLSLATLMTTSAAIRLTDAPAAVKAAITKLYPTAKNVKFEKENGDYEAGFTLNGKAISVVLDAKGNVKETETEIPVNALPAAVRDYIAKKMPGKKIREAAEMLDATGKKTFEAQVGGKDLIFDERGTLIK
ncbi:PepSY-like domain-containing protein (plasmid) [Fibrella sp. USSR17]